MNINIGKLLQNRAVLMGEKEAFVHGEKRITFNEMNEQANGFANYLMKQEFSKGDHIGLLCKNNENFTAVLMGVAKVGVVVVVLNWRLQVAELQYTGAVTMWKEKMNKEKFDSMGKSVMYSI